MLRLGNMKMAGAIRMVSVGRGHDPRDFALFAFGGAGPLHATALARELGLPTVLVPARPGITNALGCVVADLRHDFVNTVNQPVALLDEQRVRQVLERHREEGAALIAKEAVTPDTIRTIHSADMQFVGQTHILNVPLPSPDVDRATLQSLFEKAYFARFKVELPEIRANLVNLNTSVIGVRPAVDLSRLIDPAGRAATLEGALRETRPVWFDGSWLDTPVYAREKCRSTRKLSARRSSSRWTPPPCSNPATARAAMRTGILLLRWGRYEQEPPRRDHPFRHPGGACSRPATRWT